MDLGLGTYLSSSSHALVQICIAKVAPGKMHSFSYPKFVHPFPVLLSQLITDGDLVEIAVGSR